MFYDILFDEKFDEGTSVEGVVTKRLFKVSKLHLINISYGTGKFGFKVNATFSIFFLYLLVFSIAKYAVNNVSDKGQSYASMKKESYGNTQQKFNGSNPDKPILVAESTTKPIANQQDQYKKINLEDMFKVNPDNLPKPPENWRNKMVSAIGPEAAQATRNVHVESPDIVHPKPMNMCLPAFARPAQPPSTFFPQQNVVPNRPQGPQNLSRNDRNPPGHGAFIPLQARRHQAKGSKEQVSRSDERKVNIKKY